MRVPAAIITKGLDRGDSAKLSGFGIEDSFEKGVQAAVGIMTELGKQFAIIFEVDTQDLRQGKNILTMGNGRENIAAQQFAELDDLLGVTARAKPAPLTAERKQVLVTTIRAAHPGEPFAQVATFQVISNHIIDNRAPVPVGLKKLLFVIPLKYLVMRIE